MAMAPCGAPERPPRFGRTVRHDPERLKPALVGSRLSDEGIGRVRGDRRRCRAPGPARPQEPAKACERLQKPAHHREKPGAGRVRRGGGRGGAPRRVPPDRRAPPLPDDRRRRTPACADAADVPAGLPHRLHRLRRLRMEELDGPAHTGKEELVDHETEPHAGVPGMIAEKYVSTSFSQSMSRPSAAVACGQARRRRIAASLRAAPRSPA